MNTNVEMIKQLRSETGVGVMECRLALEQSGQDYEMALSALREKGMLKAKEKTNREALWGRVELYSHNDGRIGVMLEIYTETEFASRSDAFRQFGREIALQVAASAPSYVRDEDIPQQVLEELSQTATERARNNGKPEKIIERIVTGVLEKYRDEQVLLRQVYIRDENITVAQLLSQAISRIGENIVIRRFVRWEVHPETEDEKV